MTKGCHNSAWSHRYGERHRFAPIRDDPLLPNSRRGRVKIYRRGAHDGQEASRFVLNWSEQGKNLKRTVVGDKFTAVAEADRINMRLNSRGRSGFVSRQVTVEELITLYSEQLGQRSDAGEISPATAARYKSALGHLREFAEKSADGGTVRAFSIDQGFVLGFKAYLRAVEIRPNGHPNARPRPMAEAGRRFVLSVTRATWEWASTSQAQILPEGTRNPFHGHVGKNSPNDLVGGAALDTRTIVRLIQSCDEYQLVLFMPMILYGVRAAEPCYLMIEDWRREEELLTVRCIPKLEYNTKGRIDKTFPVPPLIYGLLTLTADGRTGGPLFLSRSCFESRRMPFAGLTTKESLIEEYRRRVAGNGSPSQRFRLLQQVLTGAGAVTYDQLSREFRKATHRAGLADRMTLKCLRHHFARCLEVANISYFTRKYLMGHRVRRDPLMVYTSTAFEEIHREFDRLLEGPMASVVRAAHGRIEQLGLRVGTSLGTA